MDLMDLLVKISAKDDASATISNVVKTAQSAASSIQKAFDGIGNTISQEFETVETALALVGNEAENAARTASSAFDGIGSTLSSAFEAAAAAAGSIGTAAETAAASSQSAFEEVGAHISDAFDAAATTASNIGTAMKGAAGVSSSSFDLVAGKITPQFEALAVAATGVGKSLKGIDLSHIQSALNGIASGATIVVSGLKNVASGIKSAFEGASSLASKAIKGIGTAFSGISSAASSAVNAAKSALESLASTASSVVSTISNIASTLGEVLSVAAGGIASLTSSAVSSYADYEQLVGGVETLFGAGGRTLEEYADWKGIDVSDATEKYNSLLEAQDKVFANANNAYYTSGMSANDYMDTATFLSASLISGLAGDTVEAADLIETAMVDMSDNANKFGSDLSSITNAYKGFSKRTFTMLDNLKLGYGGTTGEMARLLNDANAIDSSILGEGVTLATSGTHLLDDIGLDQMIKAIHVIQEQMDITGTTADEAMTTIQGSTNMAKAAWSDMMTAIADDNADFEGAVDKVVSSTNTALQNLIPRIQQSFSGIASLIGNLAPTVVSTVPDLISSTLPGISRAVSEIVTATAEALPGIAGAVVQSLPSTVEAFAGIGETLITSVRETAGNVLDAMTDAFQNFTGIDLSPISTALQDAGGLISGMLSSVFDNINIEPIEAVNGIIQTLGGAIGYLVDAVNNEHFKNLSSTIFGAFSAIGSSLAEHMSPAVEAIKNLIDSVMSGDSGHIDRIKKSIENFTGIFTEHIVPIIGDISSGVVSMLGGFFTVGVEVIDGIVNVLKGFFDVADDEESANRFQALARAVGEILGSFKESLAPVIELVKKKLQDLFDYWFNSEGDVEGFKQKLQNVKVVFEEIARQIGVVIEKFAQWIADVFDPEASSEEKWNSFGELVGSALGVIIEAISGVVDWFLDWKNALKDIQALIDGIIDGYNEIVKKPADAEFSIEEFEKLVGSKVLSESEKAEKAGENVGEMIERGIATGMINENSKVIQSMQKTLAKTEKSAWEAIDAHSPSKRYMKLGGFMIEGLRLGWKNGMDDMLAEMRQDYAMMERLETPTTYAEVRTTGGTALNRATTDIANALLGVSAATETGAGTPVNLVVDGKTLATVMIEPLQSVLKQKGVTLYA